MPREPEVAALLALMLLHDSRREARTDAAGDLVLLDRAGPGALGSRADCGGAGSSRRPVPGRSSPVHDPGGDRSGAFAGRARRETDWPRIARLYSWLAAIDPSPVIELNRAVAVAMVDGPEAGLALVDAIAGLDDYGPYHAARADLLRRLERPDAGPAYERAIELAGNPVERAYLERRLAAVRPG